MIQFGGLPDQYTDKSVSDILVIPVPYDLTSTWLKGSANGPEAILKASANMELYDIETDSEVYRMGIHTDAPVKVKGGPEVMKEKVRQRVKKWLDNDKYVVVLGGEHSISIGAVEAYLDKYPQLSVLQLDAHTDLRQEYEGSAFNHACVMARIKEKCPITQVGIRSMDIEEKKFVDPERIFWAESIAGSEKWMEKVVETLSGTVYLTLDLDVIDPAYMPSTGTPEPGGLDWTTVLKLIRKVIEKKDLVGFDVVELCPNPANKAPDFLAAKLIYKILSYKFRTISGQ